MSQEVRPVLSPRPPCGAQRPRAVRLQEGSAHLCGSLGSPAPSPVAAQQVFIPCTGPGLVLTRVDPLCPGHRAAPELSCARSSPQPESGLTLKYIPLPIE